MIRGVGKLVARVWDRVPRSRLTGVEYARRRGVRVGERCYIATIHFGSEPFLISIGDDTAVGPDVVVLTHNGAAGLFRDEKGERRQYRPVSIGSRVVIGARAIIVPGVRINDEVIIGAGSVVTKSIPTGWVIAGNPARKIGKFTDYGDRALADFAVDEDIGLYPSFEAKIRAVAEQQHLPYLGSDTLSATACPCR